jgi:two-component system, chemotaxis family, sensor kinase CheA
MNDHDGSFPGDLPANEMGEYLRLYLDETGEQLDALVNTLLALEADPADASGLNEAFRLIHSIKGSSALLGLDRITTLTHHLESHFERLRSGRRVLDGEVMNVVLRCIDFLRTCNEHLQRGEPLESAGELLDQVKALERSPSRVAAEDSLRPGEPSGDGGGGVDSDFSAVNAGNSWRIRVQFAPALPMAEMKAELILTRLGQLGTIIDLQPPRSTLRDMVGLAGFETILRSSASGHDLEVASRPDGVQHVVVEPVIPGTHAAVTPRVGEDRGGGDTAGNAGESGAVEPPGELSTDPAAAPPAGGDKARATTGLAETVRVDVERLDVLLNLTGELVVNRARLSQLAGDMASAFGKTTLAGRTQAVMDALEHLRNHANHTVAADVTAVVSQVESLHLQARLWDEGRQRFAELAVAIDQLTRVSNSLQRGVLNTRMVPVGPLFNRFRRTVRDIARELGKRVHLDLVGDKTELDKRMIDEIGDPLNHLVRNCIDHGIEPIDVRLRHGKPEVATVRLSAAHRGNSVFITVEDDGGGIDTARVGQIAVDRGLLTADTVGTLGEQDLIELIWQPGFSTARAVSDISGRGVGMDIVRTKITALNGSIDVESTRGMGARFTIRLPLTLTITRCMLFRLPQGVVAVPIEHVREIVSVAGLATVQVNGREVVDVRGEMLPVVTADDIFSWSGTPASATDEADTVVILTANRRSLGLRVDALLGGQEIVVKPLDEQFAHVRGLGGASILGDGSVCLLLDVANCLETIQRASVGDAVAVPERPSDKARETRSATRSLP